jgi:hypothetical protein
MVFFEKLFPSVQRGSALGKFLDSDQFLLKMLYAPSCGDGLVERSVDLRRRVTNEELLELVA